MFPACAEETAYVAARLARVWGETDAMKIFPSPETAFEWPLMLVETPFCIHGGRSDGYASRVFRTSVWDCRETRTASAEVTQPEQARQSVREMRAGGGFLAASLSSVVTS